MNEPLFTPRFLTMFAFSFTVFVSLFQLLPAAPYRVIEIGGSTALAGLFLGLLTFASAASAPFTGAIADRIGLRRVLIVVSLILAACSASYAVVSHYGAMLAIVVVHGLFWSGLLSASSAYMTATIPESRRAEGFGYWGMASVMAIAVGPALGFWVYRYGWFALCVDITALHLMMAMIAWRLPDDRADDWRRAVPSPASASSAVRAGLIEWRVMALSVTLALVAFGYGGLTSFSALFADEVRVVPRSLFLTAMASAILLGRLIVGRRLDRIGHRRVFLWVIATPAFGLTLLALASGPVTTAVAGAVFGAGFGLMYPAYAAYVMRHVSAPRRGAAFGAILAAFDAGLGTGSSALGVLIHRCGFRVAFAAAAGLAALALPYFLVAGHRLGYKKD